MQISRLKVEVELSVCVATKKGEEGTNLTKIFHPLKIAEKSNVHFVYVLLLVNMFPIHLLISYVSL